MKENKTKRLVMVGILSGMAFFLQFLGSMIGIKVGGFLDVEISDLPALIVSFAYGPIWGVIVEFIKNILHCAVSNTGFVGELANFIITGVLCLVAGVIYKIKPTYKTALVSLVSATLAMAVAGIFANYFILLPLYMPGAEEAVKLSLVFKVIFPFNIAKGIVLSVITLLIYKKISKLIK